MKHLKSLIASAFVLVALLAPLACATAGETSGKALQGGVFILDRHDAYAVELLDGAEEAYALGQSARLRSVLAVAATKETVPVAGMRGDAEAVMVRHDAWVSADGKLNAFDKQVYLHSTKLFRGLLED